MTSYSRSHRERRQPRRDVAPDVQACILHRRIVAVIEGPRMHAGLHALADRPILPVDEIPKIDDVAGVEIRFAHLVGVKEKVANDRRRSRPLRPERERGDVIGGKAEHEVRIDQLAFVAHSLVGIQRCEGARSLVPLAVNVQAPSRCGIPCSQSSARLHRV